MKHPLWSHKTAPRQKQLISKNKRKIDKSCSFIQIQSFYITPNNTPLHFLSFSITLSSLFQYSHKTIDKI